MNNPNSLENLLIQVSAIIKKYESIAEITGENFNVFKVLGLTTNEVQTHSAFITELMNPAGTHGCRAVFLKIFIDQMRQKFYDEQKSADDQKFINRFQNIKPDNSKAFAEIYVGSISDSYDEGGRIDILIKDNENNAIIIENKIHAGDQKNQLVRYNNAFPKAPIFYLTLFGSTPSDDSMGLLNEGEEFVCISYKDDIINWLEQCLKEAVNQPLLRETIQQYINLIKILTNQTINHNMEKEIASIITANTSNLESAFRIASSLSQAKKNIVLAFIESFKKALGEEWLFDLHGEILKNVAEFWFYKPYWNHSFVLSFSPDCEYLEFGLYRKDDQPCTDIYFKEIIRTKMSQLELGKILNYENWVWNIQLLEWNEMSWIDVFSGKMTEIMTNATYHSIQILEEIEL